MVIERMLVWTGARQNRALTQVTYLRASVRIDGSRTVVGYIKRQSRRDFGTHAFLDNFELWKFRSNRAFPSYVSDQPLIWADSQQFDFARLVCSGIGNSPGTALAAFTFGSAFLPAPPIAHRAPLPLFAPPPLPQKQQ